MKLYRKPAYRKGTALTIAGLMEHLRTTIDQCEQWSGRPAVQLVYFERSQILIEILEVHLDGNYGVSCFKQLAWINAGGGCQEINFEERYHNLLSYCKKKKLLPKNWKPDPYQIQ